uniref:Uncharacterized protein n=1 Tax=Mycena chlorophos TaxID=658473 RepID=A0ABQ0LW72_MYCCL|nr:predicted protein [Mycena chlorophos]
MGFFADKSMARPESRRKKEEKPSRVDPQPSAPLHDPTTPLTLARQTPGLSRQPNALCPTAPPKLILQTRKKDRTSGWWFRFATVNRTARRRLSRVEDPGTIGTHGILRGRVASPESRRNKDRDRVLLCFWLGLDTSQS